MDSPKISVIVPVYNVEQYLPRCIDSILAQTFTDFELLLIDDGSTDNSGKICDEYASKDSRIRVFHKENGGVSSARNLGLDNAEGEYILFIDGDDAISIDTLEKNLSYTNYYKHVDLIEYPAYYKYKSPKSKKVSYPFQYIGTYQKLLNVFFLHRRNEVWSYFIRKECIRTIRFPLSVKIGEDILFLLQIIRNCRSGIISRKGLYFYYFTDNSAMSSVDTKKKELGIQCTLLEYVMNHVEDNLILVDYSYVFLKNILCNKYDLTSTIQSEQVFVLFKKLFAMISIVDIVKSHLSIKAKLLLLYARLKYKIFK